MRLVIVIEGRELLVAQENKIAMVYYNQQTGILIEVWKTNGYNFVWTSKNSGPIKYNINVEKLGYEFIGQVY